VRAQVARARGVDYKGDKEKAQGIRLKANTSRGREREKNIANFKMQNAN
jgi:hypothetical protein